MGEDCLQPFSWTPREATMFWDILTLPHDASRCHSAKARTSIPGAGVFTFMLFLGEAGKDQACRPCPTVMLGLFV